MEVKGSCVCGAVAFHVEEPFVAFQYCHCGRCRKKTGSAHAANAFVEAEKLTWIRGEGHVRRFDVPDTRWSSAFCTTCGSAMPWLNRTHTHYVVPAGAFETTTEKPRRNIHFASRASWYVSAAELETFDGLP